MYTEENQPEMENTQTDGQHCFERLISKLRKVELFVSEEMGTERMEQLNENMSMFVMLFSKA